MNRREAVDLIRDAVGGTQGTWVDFGAGSGTFTRALLELIGSDGRVYAVDRDRSAVVALERLARATDGCVIPLFGDFTDDVELPGLTEPLDGILLANALHFVRDPARVLARLMELVRQGGRVALVEYDRRSANPWVPYPIPIASLPALARESGLTPFTVTATRPSAYQGVLYAAHATR